MPTMQDALIRLTEYWAEHGCLIAQSMNTEVGAGTLNPATALRVLGPEPWRAAYVEPSVRPDDARYGDNPNRLQTHTQVQVVLKPEPGNAQTLYLGSLAALGVDTRAHDVRFVEDDWASPALGAWGLGWEVWLDGLEITQFTYFQQSGGLPLDPVPVEITYGMERIVMALQGVTHFRDIRYAPGITYGEAFGQSEYELSRYYRDEADIEATRSLFETYAGEARRLLDARLPVPAHSQLLKCSHAFNVLDARGAIGTTERARAFARMRSLAREVAELWVDRRAELGHPLGEAARTPEPPAARPADLPEISAPGTFALEVGVEELPPGEPERAAAHLARELTEALEAAGLITDASGHDVASTPRRLIVVVTDLEPREPDTEQVVKGPRLTAAYDADGAPTPALLGFARSRDVDPSQVGRVTVDGGEYTGLVRRVPGRSAARVLADLLPALVGGLRAEKNMRWNAPGLAYARPIRRVLALLDEHEIPFTVGGLVSDRRTRVGDAVVAVPSAAGLLPLLREHGIEPDRAARRSRIIEAATALAGDAHAERALIEEITDLVERPVPIVGGFDERHLALPEEILVTVMREHQRYLPVRDASGRLLPRFVAVADGDCDHALVRAGNEAVLRARYEDAAFFFEQDLRRTPDEIRAGLERLTFADRLGTMADRAVRIRSVAAALASRLDLDAEELAVLRRAGELAKFDLAAAMVTELPALAGTMAREYALRAGEDERVARALLEMERPRPASLAGALLAVADRFDLLTGLFAVGAAPSGTADPFGLRRAALGLTAILRDDPRLAAITVADGLRAAARHQPVQVTPAVLDEAARFVARRVERTLLDRGHPVAVVRALRPRAGSPAHAAAAALDLTRLLRSGRFLDLVTAVQRVLRIVPAGTEAVFDPASFNEPAERGLYEAYARLREALPPCPSVPEFAEAAAPLREAVEGYFDDVLVMHDDPGVRANRLGFLAAVRDLVSEVLDWRELR